MNRFGTFARNRQNGFVALTNCFVVPPRDDTLSESRGRGTGSARGVRQLFAFWSLRGSGPSWLLQPGPARKSRLPQARHAALPELAALLRLRLRTARLLLRILRRLAGGAARSRLTRGGTLRRSAGG